MKKLFILCIFASLILLSCATTSNIPVNPSEIDYKEISGRDYCEKVGSWSSYNSNDKLTSLFLASKGYKLTNVYITGATTISEDGRTEALFELRGDKYGETVRVYVTDFITETLKSDPSIGDRIDAVSNNEKYNGKYTVYIYGELTGNAFFGYSSKAVLYNIEGIPSQEQIEADIAAEKAEQLAKEEAERNAKEEKNKKLNAIGKTIADNYIYHGIEEDTMNSELFDSEALEEGHAYFISMYMISSSGEMGGAVTNVFANPNYQYVKYKSQKIKGEVISAGKTIFGILPVSVVVAGGEAPFHIPVILGLVDF